MVNNKHLFFFLSASYVPGIIPSTNVSCHNLKNPEESLLPPYDT